MKEINLILKSEEIKADSLQRNINSPINVLMCQISNIIQKSLGGSAVDDELKSLLNFMTGW